MAILAQPGSWGGLEEGLQHLDPEYYTIQPGQTWRLVTFDSYKTLFHYHKRWPTVA